MCRDKEFLNLMSKEEKLQACCYKSVKMMFRRTELVKSVCWKTRMRSLGLSRSDHVIGNRARSRGFRLDRNRMLHPDHVSDIYFILTILISTIYFKLIITHNILV